MFRFVFTVYDVASCKTSQRARAESAHGGAELKNNEQDRGGTSLAQQYVTLNNVSQLTRSSAG